MCMFGLGAELHDFGFNRTQAFAVPSSDPPDRVRCLCLPTSLSVLPVPGKLSRRWCATSLRVLLLESRSYENEARRLAHCASWGAKSGGCPLRWPAPSEAHQGVPRVSGLSPCTSPLIPTLLLQWSFLSLLSCLVLFCFALRLLS